MIKKTHAFLLVGVLGFAALVLAVAISLFRGFVEESVWQSRYVPNIKSALGLEVASPYVDGVEVYQYFTTPNLYAYQSGLRTGDILIKHPEDSYTGDVFRAIYEARDNTGSVTFHVRRGNEIVKISFEQIPAIGDSCLKSPTTTVEGGGASFWLDSMIVRNNGCPL